VCVCVCVCVCACARRDLTAAVVFKDYAAVIFEGLRQDHRISRDYYLVPCYPTSLSLSSPHSRARPLLFH
jgi:hypothetical protein